MATNPPFCCGYSAKINSLHQASPAQELGYNDQSHLGREFKRYSGTTPPPSPAKPRPPAGR